MTPRTQLRREFVGWGRLALLFACGVALAAPAHADRLPGESGAPDARGRWHPASETREYTKLSEEQRRRIEALEAIGYLAGSVAAGPSQGVALHDRAQSGVSWNFDT